MNKWLRPIGAVGVIVLVLGACGSSGGSKPKSTTTSKETTTTTAAAPKQTVTVTPATGLTDGQTVTVVGKGFTPGATNIGITECADKGDQTGAGDCNIPGIKTAVPDASGTVTVQFVVKKGPFGASSIICSATVKCLVSVAQQTASPTEVGSQNIEFAG
jgi:hypothetical protein